MHCLRPTHYHGTCITAASSPIRSTSCLCLSFIHALLSSELFRHARFRPAPRVLPRTIETALLQICRAIDLSLTLRIGDKATPVMCAFLRVTPSTSEEAASSTTGGFRRGSSYEEENRTEEQTCHCCPHEAKGVFPEYGRRGHVKVVSTHHVGGAE